MSDILQRIELHTEEQATAAMRAAWPWAKEQLRQGRKLVATFALLDDDITEAQRGFLHGVVLTEIALYARANEGQQFPMKVWKEYFRERLLPDRRLTSVDPFTGKKKRRRVRVSTEDLGVRRLAKYIDEVIAIAATELNVQVSEPLPPHLRPQRRRAQAVEQGRVDPATGEILEATACES